MGQYEDLIHYRTYGRYRAEWRRREDWGENVDRAEEFFREIVPQKYHKELATICQSVTDKETMMSMRVLWSAGEALKRDNVAGFNCSYTDISTIKSFAEIMYILMCGGGVGFSVERQSINKLPEVPTLKDKGTTVVFGDSKLGWCENFSKFLHLLYKGDRPRYDLSKIRPRGAVLKTFGGRSSGPEPLEILLKFTLKIFEEAQGRRLNSLECYDLVCYIGKAIVSGGVRRSALISLSNLSDLRLRDAKKGMFHEQHEQRTITNNSVAYTEKPDMSIFMNEMLSLFDSGTGERGIVNREALEHGATKLARREGGHEWGVNPCCFTGDMKILTKHGYLRLDQLEGEDVDIISNDGTINKGSVWCSGEKPTVEVRFTGNHSSITCTDDHIFMLNNGEECEAKDLKGKRVMPHYEIKDTFTIDRGNAFLAGFIQGDGNTNRLNSKHHKGLEVFFGEKDSDIASMYCRETGTWYSREAMEIAREYGLAAKVLPERFLPLDMTMNYFTSTGHYTPEKKAEFLSGLYSANGCIVKDNRIALKTTCRVLADELVSILKGSLDIDAYITTNKPKTIRFSNGDYVCKESYDINISRFDSILKFAKGISFGQQYKRDALERLIKSKAPHVSAVNDFGVHKVYDFTEPKNHWGVVEGVVVHNSEVTLRPKQFCNLTEVIIRPKDTLNIIKTKVEHATALGVIQSTLTNFRFLDKKWKDNSDEERLLGVSLTGIYDHPVFSGSTTTIELVSWLSAMKQVAISTARKWSKRLDINMPTAITCVKPSGTVSQLVDCSAGIHSRFYQYYKRNVTISRVDPLAQLLIDQGVPCRPTNYTETLENCVDVLFEFPMKSPDGAVLKGERSGIEQLELWKIYQLHWCEHKPSITVNYHPDEWLDICAWVYRNWDLMSGISLLPQDGGVYPWLPYEELTKQEYTKLSKEFPEIDFTKLPEYESSDYTTGASELACVGDNCEI